MRVLGADISTYTGLCLLEGDKADTKLIHFPKEKGFDRLQLIARSFGNMIDEWEPDLICIEGYAYGNKFTLVTLVELGVTLRHEVYRRGLSWYEVPPSKLKLFTTGKGTAKKPDMAKAVLDKWGFSSKSDDVVDAYALARIGQAIASGNKTVIKGVTHHAYDNRRLSAQRPENSLAEAC